MTTNPLITWNKQVGTISNDQVTSIAIGFDGSIYAVGYTEGTIDTKNNSGFAVGIGGQKNLGLSDAFIAKFYGDGTQLWTNQIGSNSWDSAKAISIGSDGSIYIAGDANASVDGQAYLGSSDAFITKLSPNGTKLWTKQIGTSSVDQTSGLASGSDGSIYITGYTEGSINGAANAGFSDSFLAKFSIEGIQLWTNQIGSNSWDSAKAISIGSDGSIYIAGDANGSVDGQAYFGSSDAFLVKYNSSGTKLWTKQIGTSKADKATGIASGPDGSIYLTGYTEGSIGGKNNLGFSDAFLMKFASNGTQLWSAQVGSNSWDSAKAISIGSDDAVYIAGDTNASIDGQPYLGGSDVFLMKFSSNGNKIWTQQIGSPDNDNIHSVSLDRNGLIYIGGETLGSLYGPINNSTNNGNSDGFIARFEEFVTQTPLKNGIKYTSTPKPDRIEGTVGIDFFQEYSNLSGYEITKLGNGNFQIQSKFNSLNVDTASLIERIEFSDHNLALDINGSAGQVAKIVGAVFGTSYISNYTYVGIGLSYLDGGMSYKDLCGLAAAAAGLSTPDVLVTTLLKNIYSTEPTNESKAPYLQSIANGNSYAQIVEQLVDSLSNIKNIKLTDLANTGLAYTPYALPPTYSLSAASASVTEGSTAVFNLTTTNVAVGTEVSYTLSGISSSDLTLGTLTGKVSVGVGGTASISIPIAADDATEVQESLTISAQGATASIVINDTSKGSAAPTYTLTPATLSVNEGQLAQVYVSTTNVAVGTSLQFGISGVGITQGDVIEGLSRFVTVDSTGKAVININTVADQLTEGPETMYITLGTSTTSFIINDTSIVGIPPQDPVSY
jgi:hypothetical protein